ncbi:MAG: hypothetical protein WAN86_02305 [Hyphomicrobiaceae bacterium]
MAPRRARCSSPGRTRPAYAGVRKDRARTELRIRLGPGAEIPRGVALFTFPHAVMADVPQVALFRYIVVENDVVIVDPADYEIATGLTIAVPKGTAAQRSTDCPPVERTGSRLARAPVYAGCKSMPV